VTEPALETRHIFDYPRGQREALKFLSWLFLGCMVSFATLPWLLPRDPARLEVMAAAIFFAVAAVVCLFLRSFFSRRIIVDSRGMTSVRPGGEEELFCWDDVTGLRERPQLGTLEFQGGRGKKPLKVGYALLNLEEFLRIALARMDWARLQDGATGPSGTTLSLPAEFRLPKLSILLLVLVDLLLLVASILFLRRAHELFQAGWARGSMATALAFAALIQGLYLSLRLPLCLRVDSRAIQVRRPLSRKRIPTGEIVAVRIERSLLGNNRCPRVVLTARNGKNTPLPNLPWGLLSPYRAVLTALGDLKGFPSRASR